MGSGLGITAGALALVVGFPLLLLVGVGILAWLEQWMLQPYERAVRIEALLAQEEEVEDVERGVVQVLADVVDHHPGRHPRPVQMQKTAS